MKTKTLCSIILCALFTALTVSSHAQLPEILWAKKFGGSSTDVPFTTEYSSDGGTISAGYTESKDGLVGYHNGREYWDLWVVKLSKCGELQWQKSFGGSGYEAARDLIQTPDGGYLVVGETNSTDGDVIAGYGDTRDIWIIKLDINGNLLWQKRYGGSGLDIANTIHALPDGHFLVSASTSSNDGDFTDNHGTAGYTDGALLKINGQGAVIWSRCFGGTKNEELLDIEITADRIFAAGYANSTDGDIPADQKNYDVWLLATDFNGKKIFSKVYGGAQNDVGYSMCKGYDGSLTIAGYTTSNDGDVSGAKGSQDFWIINLSTGNGRLNWQKTLGGSEAEFANSIVADGDGGYLAGGISYSSDGDITDPRKEGDFWVVKLNAIGHTMWTQSYGGKDNDHLHSIIYDSTLNEYYLSGDVSSQEGFTGTSGAADFGIIKLKLPNVDTVLCTDGGNNIQPDTLKDICGYDSAIVICRPPTQQEKFKFDGIRVPNAFSPNGDGVNDQFGAAAARFVDGYMMQIFNRYGELIFQSNSIDQRWNGVYKGKPQPAGSFVYSIRYKDNNQKIQIQRGPFTLFR